MCDELVNKKNYNNKIKDIEDKIPSITNLATTAALSAVENKIPSVTNLVKKVDYDLRIKGIESKYLLLLIKIHLLIIY